MSYETIFGIYLEIVILISFFFLGKGSNSFLNLFISNLWLGKGFYFIPSD